MKLPTVRHLFASLAVTALASGQPAAETRAASGANLPVVLVSASGAFDRDCANYYSQGNDPEVISDQGVPESFCECLADWYRSHGLAVEALDFFARTYSDDLTTFIHEYPDGEAWMQLSFKADQMCKSG
jgi:hypothetical protein